MRSFFYILSALIVVGLAFWAYRENYETQAAQDRAERLETQIAGTRQRLRVLKAEWAYLNRPDRLRDLAELNYERLGLLPLQPHQFGRVDQVAYPPVEGALEGLPIDLSNSVDVSAQESVE